MISRRTVLATVLVPGMMAVAPAAFAADQTPKQFLEAIYQNYVGANTAGLPIDKSSTLRLFTPSLRKAIDDDAKRAAKHKAVPNLDGDPFINAQDWDIKSFDISVQDTGANKAAGTVKFKNEDEDEIITLDLVKGADGWQIDEITTADGTLRKILSGK